MAEVDSALVANRAAVEELLAAAERCGGAWTAPRSPGKWSPSQVIEHVARALEESANVVSGAPSKFPTFPLILRPLVRSLFFKQVLKKSAFPKARTNKAFDPMGGQATVAEARVRLEAALAQFEQECRVRAAGGRSIDSTIFGNVPVVDYVRFQELHARHHQKQIPGSRRSA